jgi:hypothetical protein
VVEALRDHVFWRRNYHPEDGFAIRETDKRQEGYEETEATLTQELMGLLAELKVDRSMSGRHTARMVWSCCSRRSWTPSSRLRRRRPTT